MKNTSNEQKDSLIENVKVRFTAKEKPMLKQIAADAGLTMSELIRATIFSEKKLVFLVQGADIAAALFQIRKDLEQLCRESVIPASEISRLETAMNEVATLLRAVAAQITDIHDLDGAEVDDDETN